MPRTVAQQLAILAALALVMDYAPASAHSMDYALRGTGEVRIVMRYASGPPMTGADYRVFAPGGGDGPVATGLTDSSGEVGFRATRDGRWRIEASDGTGQIFRARVDVTNGVPAIGGRRLPDWLVAVSLALNILLAVGFALDRRARLFRRRPAAGRAAPSRHAASPTS